MRDLSVYDNGVGGDYVITSDKDLGIDNAMYNQVDLALFGTKENKEYWANNLLNTKFRSLTQEYLQNMPLTSAARNELIRLVKKDLEYLEINTVDVSFKNNKVCIFVNEIIIEI